MLRLDGNRVKQNPSIRDAECPATGSVHRFQMPEIDYGFRCDCTAEAVGLVFDGRRWSPICQTCITTNPKEQAQCPET